MQSFDVTVIGGGVVGCSVVRELSRFNLRVLLLEREADVSCGTSGANSGVVHSGFKEEPGSLKAEYSRLGNKIFPKLCRELSVPFRRVGTVIIATEGSEVRGLEKMRDAANRIGVERVTLLSRRELSRREPNVHGVAGLLAPSGGIVTPYLLTIALAENAVANGVKVMLDSEVKDIRQTSHGFKLKTAARSFLSEYVVNSAGLYADRIVRMVGKSSHTVYPCRGEYLILDKKRRNLVNSMVYPVMPKGLGEVGVHITPTLEGNLLLGPTAEYVRDKDDVSLTASKMDELIVGAQHLVPSISKKDVIRGYSGIRSRIVPSDSKVKGDFVIQEKPDCFINLFGMESPALTAAPVIAGKVLEIIQEGRKLKPNRKFNPVRRVPKRFDELSSREKAALIRRNPAYGEVVCRCENVSKSEVIRALNNPLGVRTLKGLKYRARVLMGRCQGGVCIPRIAKIYDELGVPLDDVTLKGEGSELFAGWSR